MAKKSAVEKTISASALLLPVVSSRGIKSNRCNKNVSMEERFQAVLKLANEPQIALKFVSVTVVRSPVSAWLRP